jgi:hypothetical protein
MAPTAEPLHGDLCRLLLQRRGVGGRLHDENLRKGEGLVPGEKRAPRGAETMAKIGRNHRFRKGTLRKNHGHGFKTHQKWLISQQTI